MKLFFKIALLLIAIFPVWLTIIAFAEGTSPSQLWKNAINQKLIEQSGELKKVQIVEFSSSSDVFADDFLKESFEVKMIEPKPKGFSMLEIVFRDQAGKLQRVLRVPARLMIEGRVVVAVRDLNRGQKIQATDVSEEWRDLSTVTGSSVSMTEVVGRTLKAPVKSGRVILSPFIENQNLVRVGDRVRIIVSGNGLMISSFGIARQNGQKGETIKVLNPDSKREIYGVVSAEQVVEVKL